MKLKLLLQILILSSFSYILQANTSVANQTAASVVQSVPTIITLTGATDHPNLTFSIVTQPSHGTLSGLTQVHPKSATVIYTSTNSFAGQDTFTFQVTNNLGLVSASATVFVNVSLSSARAYITDYPSSTSQVGIINVASHSAVGNVSGQPNYGDGDALMFLPNQAKAYVSYLSSISVINTASNVTLPNVSDPSGNLNSITAMAMSPNGSFAYISNNVNSTVSILDTTFDIIIASNVNDPNSYIQSPGGVTFTPDGSRAYVTNHSYGTVCMIDVATNTVVTQISGAATPIDISELVISPDGNFGYVVFQNGGFGGGSVYILDTNPTSPTYNTFIGTIDDSLYHFNDAVCMAIKPNGLKAYVGNAGSSVSIVDLNPASGTYRKVTGLVTGSFNFPISVAFTADGSQAYVVNNANGPGFVSIINVSSDAVAFTISGYTNPQSLVFLGDNPTANPTAASVLQSVPTIITVTGTDPENETLTFSIAKQPLYGTLAHLDNPTTTSARYTYFSTGTYIGADSFVFQVTNSSSLVSFPATVSLMILPQSVRSYAPDNASNNAGIISVPNESTVGLINDPNSLIYQPLQIAVSPSGAKAYIACGPGNNTVVSVNALTNTVIKTVDDTLSPFDYVYAISFTPDGKKAYVANSNNNTVSIINVAADATIGFVDPQSFPFDVPLSMAITPDGMKAYVVNQNGRNVSIIDLNSLSSTYNKVVGYVQDTHPWISGDIYNIAITPDGTRAYLVDGGNSSVVIIDVVNDATVGLVQNSQSFSFDIPASIAITSDGMKAYVCNEGDSTISIIDINPASGNYNKVTGFVTVSFGAPPSSVAFTADGYQAYVSAPGSGSITVIDVASNTGSYTIPGYVRNSWVSFLGIGSPFSSVTNQLATHVEPVASALDPIKGIMYEVGNAQDGSGDLVIMASGAVAGNFGPISSFTKSGQSDGGVISYSTSSLLNIGGTSFTQLDMALQTINGVSKVIVSGSNNLLNKGFVARFNTIPVANSLDGVLDDTFGDFQSGNSGPRKGYTVFTGVSSAAGCSTFSACAVDADQNVVVAGSVGGATASTGQLLIARYTAANGVLDTTFGPQNPINTPQLGYGYSTILGLSGPGYSLIINDIEFDPLKNIFIVGQYQAPLIPAPGLSPQGVAGTSPFVAKFVHLGIPDQTFYNQYGTLMIPMQYVNGQGEFTKCVYDINPISNLSSPTMYASGVVQNLKTSPTTDYATLIRFSIANLNLSASQAYISGNSGTPLTNLQGNVCPSLVVPAVTAVTQIKGAQGIAVHTFNSIKTSQDVQSIISLSGIVYNLINSLEGIGASAIVAQSIGNNFQSTMIAIINDFVANHPGNLLQNFLYLSQSIAVNECLLTTNVSKFLYLQLIYAAEKAIQINIKTAASYCTSPLISPYV